MCAIFQFPTHDLGGDSVATAAPDNSNRKNVSPQNWNVLNSHETLAMVPLHYFSYFSRQPWLTASSSHTQIQIQQATNSLFVTWLCIGPPIKLCPIDIIVKKKNATKIGVSKFKQLFYPMEQLQPQGWGGYPCPFALIRPLKSVPLGQKKVSTKIGVV